MSSRHAAFHARLFELLTDRASSYLFNIIRGGEKTSSLVAESAQSLCSTCLVSAPM